MKKILIFSMSYYPLPVSGAEAAIDEITKRIDPNDITFHLIANRYTTAAPKIEQRGNVLVHRIGIARPNPDSAALKRFPLSINKILYQFLAAFKALVLHRTYHYDAVWVMMAHTSGVPSVLFRWCVPKVGYILTLQEGDPIEHIERSVRPLWPLFTRAFTRAEVVQAISHSLSDWARARGATCPIVLIHNGANPNDFLDIPFPVEALETLKDSVGKKDGDVLLINTARLEHQKAHDIVIRALVLLPPHVKFLVVGDGGKKNALQLLAHECGVAQRVIFTGHVDRSEVTKYRRIADIFVMPSRSEGLGNAGLSAMASKLPVIATREGGLAEYVFGDDGESSYGKTAWVVPKDDPGALACAVVDILSSPMEVARVTANARRMVETEYHWDAIAHAMRERVFARGLREDTPSL